MMVKRQFHAWAFVYGAHIYVLLLNGRDQCPIVKSFTKKLSHHKINMETQLAWKNVATATKLYFIKFNQVINTEIPFDSTNNVLGFMTHPSNLLSQGFTRKKEWGPSLKGIYPNLQTNPITFTFTQLFFG